MSHNIEDHEESGEGIPPLRWSWWDLAGLTFFTAGTMLNELDNGLRMIAGRLGAHANWERARKDQREAEYAQEVARAEMAGTLEGLVLFAGDDEVEGP